MENFEKERTEKIVSPDRYGRGVKRVRGDRIEKEWKWNMLVRDKVESGGVMKKGCRE